ncbi:MAG TPA: hypothetical protein PLO78_09980 [Candidatus Omnitrophota bacterium]|nr:hypothetical protein [Candidatus Omnitrophota bacterium]
MTLYEQLIDLKYHRGVSTCELVHLFPSHIKRVSEVALLEVPEKTLRRVVREKKRLERLINLKREFLKAEKRIS